ncbi:MAG: basic rane protein [Chloroflexota bacterium]|nr:basic rane protein [Chloroflexota bacterium]
MNAKRITILSLLVIGSILLAACGSSAAATEEPAAAASDASGLPVAADTTVVQIVNGTLGDKSFTDSANRGLTKAAEDFGFNLVVSEAGLDPAKWEPAFMDAVQDPDVDVLVVGTSDLMEIMLQAAVDYPEKTFIMFDNPVDFEAGDYGNVYAVQYKQNEGSYLAGLYAGLMSQTGMVGAVGGMDIPVINDFMVGYVQGAGEAGIPAENVLVQYAGGWSDPAKGKELALTIYQQGADVVFQVAGGTGEGVFYAAQESGNWAIGVDSDQYTIEKETNPELADTILTSMLKNVDNSLYRALSMYFDGTLPVGTNEVLGIAEGGVGLAYNDYYEEMTPQDVKDKIAETQQKVIDGDIVIETVF